MALLAAIKAAHPDDDTSRLVYADWLQENDQEDQAAAIRENVDLRARLHQGLKMDGEWQARRLKFGNLVFEKMARWFDGVVEWFDHEENTLTNRREGRIPYLGGGVAAWFDRGMLCVRGNPDALKVIPEKLWPWLYRFEIDGASGGAKSLIRTVAKTGVVELAFDTAYDDERVLLNRFVNVVSGKWPCAIPSVKYIDFGRTPEARTILKLTEWPRDTTGHIEVAVLCFEGTEYEMDDLENSVQILEPAWRGGIAGQTPIVRKRRPELIIPSEDHAIR
jgi:uncharacterized protein (TIGR02996 family)